MMIALTQEKREELIEAAKFIATGGDKSITAQIARIALASLTAEPFGYVDEDAIEAGEALFSTTLYADTEDLFDYSGNKNPVPLYLSPPFQGINLPNKFNEAIDDYFDSGKGLGWNKCLVEIKRLNGLEE